MYFPLKCDQFSSAFYQVGVLEEVYDSVWGRRQPILYRASADAFPCDAAFAFGTFGVTSDIMNLSHGCFRLVLDRIHSVNLSSYLQEAVSDVVACEPVLVVIFLGFFYCVFFLGIVTTFVSYGFLRCF